MRSSGLALCLALVFVRVAKSEHVFRVFHSDKLTPRVRELHRRSAELSGIPLSRHRLVVFNTHFANMSLELCNATEAYESLLPPAYQADLMRYCLLYLYGGVYIDLMMTLTHPSHHLFNYDLATVQDTSRNCMSNGFIAGRRGHPAFKTAIGMIKTNVQECRLTSCDLGPTGPRLWYNALREYNPTILGKLEICNEEYDGCGRVKNLLINKLPGYREEFIKMGYKPAMKYTRLWRRGKIYLSCPFLKVTTSKYWCT